MLPDSTLMVSAKEGNPGKRLWYHANTRDSAVKVVTLNTWGSLKIVLNYVKNYKKLNLCPFSHTCLV